MPKRGGVLLWTALAGALSCLPAAAEDDTRIAVRRTVEFTSADWDGDDAGRLSIEALLEERDGKLAGLARVTLDWTWPHPPCERDAGFRNVTGVGPVEGTIVDGRLEMNVAVPIAGSYTSLLGSFLGVHVCLSQSIAFTYDATAMEWGRFDVPLADGRHDSTVISRSTEGGSIVLPGLVHTTVGPASAEDAGIVASPFLPEADTDWDIELGPWSAAPALAGEGHGDGRPVLAPFLRDGLTPPR
jgi:hypothetical protein